MGQIKHKMGKVGGGVDISHKSKMSGKAKSLMSFPGGMPGPGDYGKMDQPAKIVGKGMAKYLAGESVGMRKMDPMYNGQSGVQQEDFEQFGAPKSTGPAKKKRKLTAEQQKLVNEIRSKRAKKEQAAKAAKTQKKKVNKELDTFLKAGGEVSSGPGKYTRANKTKQKAQDAKDEAEKTFNDSGVTVKGTRQGLKADRLAKRQKRQEGRAERKKIRKAGLSRGEKRKQIIDSREKQNSTKKDNTQTGGSGLGTSGMMKAGPAKKVKRKGLLKRANKEIARKNTDGKKVERLVKKYVDKNK
tara:strand:- start:58 stop:954 length:897 start_codon:yes stop_codon:yes gene_type:complete